MKTFAAILEKTRSPLIFRELEVPALKAGQLLVKVRHSSLCHTQINEILGLKGEDKFLPHTLGHEGFGIVQEVGEGVTKVTVGDEVVLTWLKGAGMDIPGTQYRWDGKTVNSGAVSTFMNYAVVSENRVVKVSGVSVAPELMPLFGCAVPTGVGIVMNSLKPQPGQSIAIWGMGGIGMSVLMGAVMAGCRPIIAIDIQQSKLEKAKTLGATHVVNGTDDPVAQILALTDGRGVDFGVDAAGHIQTIESGYAAIRKGGGRFVVAGNPPAGQKIGIDPMDLISGKQIVGTWGGESKIESDLPRYVEQHRAGRLPVDRLVTHRLPLDQINHAVELMVSGQAGRILLNHESL